MNTSGKWVKDNFDLDILNEEIGQEDSLGKGFRVNEEAVDKIQKAMKLNFSEEQLKIITHSCSPLNVLSCAGSGKSTVLVAKMLYREIAHEIKPVNMLGITFNKDASAEIEERYREARAKARLGRGSMPTFKTFHSLFLMILRNIDGYSKHKVVQEGKYTFPLLKLVISDGSTDKMSILNDMLAHRGSLINHGLSKDGLQGATFNDVNFNEDNYRKVIAKYIELKNENNELDFDDMLVFLHTELIENENEDAKEAFRRVFKDVYIDEYQDISRIQMDIMDKLILDENRFVTIGDDDQSIYGFRGSDPEFIRDFIYRYPNAERLFLGDNYRCKENILNPVIASISKNEVRVDKSIRAFNQGGDVEVIPIEKTYNELAGKIKYDTKDMYASDFDDIGILVRLNSQRMIIADVLAENGVQVDIGGMNYSLRADKVYKTAIGLVNAIKNEDNALFAEYGRAMFRSVNRNVFDKYKHDKRRNWYEETIVDNRYNLPEQVLAIVKKIKKTNNMKNAIGYVWKQLQGYYEGLAKGGFGRIDKVIEIYRHLFEIADGLTIEQFRKSERMKEGFLSMYCGSGNGVQIKTLHSVKGLEFKTVYLIGLDGQKFPNEGHMERLREKGGTEERDYVEEERRLFYVGWTRAIDRLVISYNKKDPSMFLTEVEGLNLPGITGEEAESS